MQPTPPTPNPAPPMFEPVIELIRTQRPNVGYALLVAATVCLAGTAWLALKTTRLAPAPDAAAKDKDKAEDPFKALPLDGGDVAQPNRVDYYIGAGGALLAFAAFAAAGGFLLAAPPKRTDAEQRTQARQLVLLLGSCAGAVLILAGGLYFYQWSGSLVKWLDKGEIQEARWALIPLLMVVVGGGLMFVSVQPARAEERNNARLRQFVYGSNFGLTVLMLVVVLVIANVAIALRLPNKLDVTTSGFYTLSPQTQQLLEGLDQPVHAYAIFQDSGDTVTEDIKRLLASCQETNPARFRVTMLSPALNKAEINKLKTDYPLAELSREGVLLVAGDEGTGDRKRHSFIRGDEFEDTKNDAEGRPVPAFNGEPKLLRELIFLAESKQKPKIYFTQSSGELALAAGGRAGDPKRTATGLKAYLEKNYFDVAELRFELTGPAKVPDDAAVVVVADPTAPLPANGVEALRKYMSDPRPDGKKGKLVVLAGLQQGADRKPLVLGLEPVLQTYGVRLGDRFLYGQPLEQLAGLDRAGGTRVMLAMVTQEAADARNPVALGFNKLDRLPLIDCRELISGPAEGAQPVRVLVSQPGRLTWTEQQFSGNSAQALDEFRERANRIRSGPGTPQEKQRELLKLEAEAQLSTDPRELAVFVSEGPAARGGPAEGQTARVAVFGCGWFVSDDASGRAGRGQAATLWLDLMGSTLDWVRDRPIVGVQEKPYSVYTLKPGYDSFRMLWVPPVLMLLAVTGLGAGVWVIRRK